MGYQYSLPGRKLLNSVTQSVSLLNLGRGHNTASPHTKHMFGVAPSNWPHFSRFGLETLSLWLHNTIENPRGKECWKQPHRQLLLLLHPKTIFQGRPRCRIPNCYGLKTSRRRCQLAHFCTPQPTAENNCQLVQQLRGEISLSTLDKPHAPKKLTKLFSRR